MLTSTRTIPKRVRTGDGESSGTRPSRAKGQRTFLVDAAIPPAAGEILADADWAGKPIRLAVLLFTNPGAVLIGMVWAAGAYGIIFGIFAIIAAVKIRNS